MLTAACFFMISVAYKLAWTAISSLLTQFSRDYGPEVLLHLNVAYFFPSIPVLVLQTMFNPSMDRRFGLPLAALMRFTLGLGGLACVMSYFPLLATSYNSLLATTVLVGLLYGIVFGTSYQLASKFPPSCMVALTTGFVSSGPVVLLLDLMIKKGPFYSAEGLAKLFGWVSVIICIGLVAACWVVLTNVKALRLHTQHVHHVALRLPSKGWMDSHDSASGRKLHHRGGFDPMGHAGAHAAISLETMESGDQGSGTQESPHPFTSSTPPGMGSAVKPSSKHLDNDDGKQSKRDVPLRTLAWRVSPAALSIFLSVGTSMFVFPFFTFVQHTGLLGDRLAQVLFYVRLVGDIVGRLFPQRLLLSSAPKLIGWGLAKTAMVPLLLLAIFHPQLCLGDLGAVLLVGVFWVLSGYLNTCSYLLAPQLVSPSQKARASGIMTVAFQSSCFAALMVAGAIQRML